MIKLVKLSKTRVLLDPHLYQQFGRFMVQVETRMHKFGTQGLLQQAFLPYHYLRQCLKQMRMTQEKALEEEKGEGSKMAAFKRHADAAQQEADKEEATDVASLDKRFKDMERQYKSKFDFGRREAKTKKLRGQEQRAGRVFTSVSQTIR